ncbi:hypothetical protein ACLOJK_037324 [Asimina triloba]
MANPSAIDGSRSSPGELRSRADRNMDQSPGPASSQASNNPSVSFTARPQASSSDPIHSEPIRSGDGQQATYPSSIDGVPAALSGHDQVGRGPPEQNGHGQHRPKAGQSH